MTKISGKLKEWERKEARLKEEKRELEKGLRRAEVDLAEARDKCQIYDTMKEQRVETVAEAQTSLQRLETATHKKKAYVSGVPEGTRRSKVSAGSVELLSKEESREKRDQVLRRMAELKASLVERYRKPFARSCESDESSDSGESDCSQESSEEVGEKGAELRTIRR